MTKQHDPFSPVHLLKDVLACLNQRMAEFGMRVSRHYTIVGGVLNHMAQYNEGHGYAYVVKTEHGVGGHPSATQNHVPCCPLQDTALLLC